MLYSHMWARSLLMDACQFQRVPAASPACNRDTCGAGINRGLVQHVTIPQLIACRRQFKATTAGTISSTVA